MSDTPKILVADTDGDFLGLALLLQKESYPFTYVNLTTDEIYKNNGDGLLNDVSEKTTHVWRSILRYKPGEIIIIYPEQYMPHMQDYLRKQGHIIIGGGSFPEMMEYQRSRGLELMQDIGLKTPKEEVFTSLRDAISYMQEQAADTKKYFKGEGAEMAGNSYTYGGKNKEDMVAYLLWLKDETEKKGFSIKKFILQDFIDGYTVDFSFYFDGKDMLPGSIAIDIEEKKGEGTYGGSALGCSANFIMFLKKTKYQQYFDKLIPYLRKTGYRGQWSINNVFEKKTGIAYGIEHTSRFGHDSFETEQLIHQKNGKKTSDFILALAGLGTFDFPHSLIGYGVRIHCDYPTTENKKVKGRYFTFDKTIADNLYFYNVSRKNEYYVCEANPVAVAVTAEKTFEAAVTKMNEGVLPKINLADMFARSVPPDNVAESIRFLQKYAWL